MYMTSFSPSLMPASLTRKTQIAFLFAKKMNILNKFTNISNGFSEQ